MPLPEPMAGSSTTTSAQGFSFWGALSASWSAPAPVTHAKSSGCPLPDAVVLSEVSGQVFALLKRVSRPCIMLYVVDEPEPTMMLFAGDAVVDAAPAGRAAPREIAAAPTTVAPKVVARQRREVGLLAIGVCSFLHPLG